MAAATPLEIVLGALVGNDERPKLSGGQYKLHCPGHPDEKPSLAVKEAEPGGAVLLRCHAGCETEAVVDAAGLAMSDLFPHDDDPVILDNAPAVEAAPRRLRVTTTRYRIRRRDGTHYVDHVRRDPGKHLWWEQLDGTQELVGPSSAIPLFGIHKIDRWPADARLVLVEGEKTAVALQKVGVPALGTCCGAQVTPDDDVLVDLAGRDVTLWADADSPGRKHMTRIADKLTGVAASVWWTTWPDAPPKGDAADLIAAGGDPFDVLDAAVPYAPEATVETPLERPRSARERPWPSPLADALYGLAGDYVRAVQPHSEADPAALLTGFLATAGALIGPDVAAVAGDAAHPGRINVIHVGDSAKGRKGTGMAPTRVIATLADPEFAARIASGLSSGEGLIFNVRDPVEKVVEVGKGADRHQELQVVDEGVEDKRLLVVESEYASVLRVMQRDGNSLSPVIRLAWDSGDLRTLTRNNPLTATGVHIAIVGQITRDELVRYLDRTDLASGFANRHLFVAVRRAAILPDGEAVPRDELVPLADRLRSVVEWSAAPRLLRRDETAGRMWRAVYEELSAGRPGLLGAATNRAEAQVLRLSVIYAALDQGAEIRGEHLLAALDVWRYADESAYWVFGDAVGDVIADTILAALRSHGAMSRSDIRELFQRHVRSARVQDALTALLTANRIERTVETTGGRSREVYRAVDG